MQFVCTQRNENWIRFGFVCCLRYNHEPNSPSIGYKQPTGRWIRKQRTDKHRGSANRKCNVCQIVIAHRNVVNEKWNAENTAARNVNNVALQMQQNEWAPFPFCDLHTKLNSMKPSSSIIDLRHVVHIWNAMHRMGSCLLSTLFVGKLTLVNIQNSTRFFWQIFNSANNLLVVESNLFPSKFIIWTEWRNSNAQMLTTSGKLLVYNIYKLIFSSMFNCDYNSLGICCIVGQLYGSIFSNVSFAREWS